MDKSRNFFVHRSRPWTCLTFVAEDIAQSKKQKAITQSLFFHTVYSARSYFGQEGKIFLSI